MAHQLAAAAPARLPCLAVQDIVDPALSAWATDIYQARGLCGLCSGGLPRQARQALSRAPPLPIDANQIWGRLTRHVAPAVVQHPELYTLLPVPNSFVIPGARFREVRSWAAGTWASAVFRRPRRACSSSLPARSLARASPLLRPCCAHAATPCQGYYWDSTWIIKGLLASNLTELAEAR